MLTRGQRVEGRGGQVYVRTEDRRQQAPACPCRPLQSDYCFLSYFTPAGADRTQRVRVRSVTHNTSLSTGSQQSNHSADRFRLQHYQIRTMRTKTEFPYNADE